MPRCCDYREILECSNLDDHSIFDAIAQSIDSRGLSPEFHSMFPRSLPLNELIMKGRQITVSYMVSSLLHTGPGPSGVKSQKKNPNAACFQSVACHHFCFSATWLGRNGVRDTHDCRFFFFLSTEKDQDSLIG